MIVEVLRPSEDIVHHQDFKIQNHKATGSPDMLDQLQEICTLEPQNLAGSYMCIYIYVCTIKMC